MNIPIEEILAQYKRNAAAADGSDEEDEESEEYTGSASDEDNEESSGSKSESESDEGEKEAEGKEGCCKSKKEAEPPKKRCKKEWTLSRAMRAVYSVMHGV